MFSDRAEKCFLAFPLAEVARGRFSAEATKKCFVVFMGQGIHLLWVQGEQNAVRILPRVTQKPINGFCVFGEKMLCCIFSPWELSF